MEEVKILGRGASSQGVKGEQGGFEVKVLQFQQFRKLSALLFGTHILLIMFIK